MIFVTGGTGLLGNSIVRHLCEQGIATAALCRPGTSRKAFEGLDLKVVEGSLDSEDTLASAIEGSQAVIHSAAFIHIGWRKLQESRAVNVQGTQRVANACAKTGARLVHVSTVDTLPAAIGKDQPMDERAEGGVGKTQCSYVVSKTEAERAVVDLIGSANLDAVIVLPGFMLGPYDWKPSSGRMMLEVNQAPILAAPPGGCSVCDVRDVASAIVAAVDRGKSGAKYILAGENLTYQELWTKMLATTGRQRRVFRMGRGIRLIGQAIDLANRLLPLQEKDVNGAAIAMGSLNHFYDSSKAKRELGYHWRPVEETLADAWDWLRATH